MVQRTGLGKGLSSLIPKAQPSQVSHAVNSFQDGSSSGESFSMEYTGLDTQRLHQLPIDKIVPNPMQPRRIFNHKELEELVASIKEHGVLQPLIVTRRADGFYELISGERRLRSSKIAGLRTVPAIIREAGELEKLELALIENIQRQDLNPMEKAESYNKLIDEFGLTQEEAAKRLGIQRSTLANTLRLLTLPSEIQKALADGKLTAGHARALLSLPSVSDQMRLFEKILMTGMNVRDVETQTRQGGGVVRRHISIDPNLEDRRNRLQQALGTKVLIKKQGSGGTIQIHFYSDEELRALTDRLV